VKTAPSLARSLASYMGRDEYHPDYGVFLRGQQAGSAVGLYFYDVPIVDLSIINDELFCTTLNLTVEGKEYAASFDFPANLFERLMSHASHGAQECVARAIKSRRAWPLTITMLEPFSIGLRAHLGELQRNENEEFIPLVVEEVFSAAKDGASDMRADEHEHDSEEDVESDLYLLNDRDKRIIDATKQLLWKIVRSSLVAPIDLIKRDVAHL